MGLVLAGRPGQSASSYTWSMRSGNCARWSYCVEILSTGKADHRDHVAERLSLVEFHRDEVDAVGLFDRVNRDDVRVIECSERYQSTCASGVNAREHGDADKRQHDRHYVHFPQVFTCLLCHRGVFIVATAS